MRASDLVKIDLHGNVVEEGDTTSRRVNAAGFTIHSAIHMARPDLMCVVHTHTQAGIAVSAMQEGLLPIVAARAEILRAASPITAMRGSRSIWMSAIGW